MGNSFWVDMIHGLCNYIRTTKAVIRVYYLHWGNLPVFVLLYFIRLLVGWIERGIFWPWNGVKWHMDLIRKKKLDNNLTAHMSTIWAACKLTPFDKIRKCYYLTWHHSFVDPSYVLNDHVVLAEVQPEYALFVELKRPLSYYKMKTHPLLFITMVNEAVRLLEMPLDVFHQLADQLPDPQDHYEQVAFLFNAGRCGSTLVALMAEELAPDSMLSLSEPPVLFDFVWYKRRMTHQNYCRMLRSAMRLQMKPISGKTRVFIKPNFNISGLAKDFHRVFPRFKLIFCHRDPIQVIMAHERAFGASPMCKFLQFVIWSKWWYFAGAQLGIQRYPFVEKVINRELKSTMFECCTVIWQDQYRRYKEMAQIFDYPELNYDDLLENPAEFTKKLVSLLNLPPETNLKNVFQALKNDSQADTVVSQKVLRSIPRSKYNPEIRIRVDKFCDDLNLPKLNWDKMMKNTYYPNNPVNNHMKNHTTNNSILKNGKAKMS